MAPAAQREQQTGPSTRADYRLRRQEQKKIQQQKIKRQRLLLIAGAVMVVIAVMILGDLLGNAGKIHGGVRVVGINLGGKTPTKAREFLTEELGRGQKRSITVTHDKQSWQISPADLGIRYDVAQMVSDAYQVGREKNVFQAVAARVALYFRPQTIMLRVASDAKKEAAAYGKITKITDTEPVNASVSLKGATFTVSDGSDGVALQRQALTNLITYASLNDQKTVKAPVKVARRVITSKEAQIAATTAQNATKLAIAAQYADKTWQLDQATLSKLFVFKLSNDLDKNDAQLKLPGQKSTDQVVLVPIVASAAVAKDIIPLLGVAVGTAPVNASFQAANGVVTIIPGKNGTGADPVKLAKDLAAQMQSSGEGRSVTVVTHAVEPELTTAKAKALGITGRISTYTTYFTSGNAARLTNITLMAKALDGALVMPGATFSLNGTVGEADAAKGYQEAGAIVDGKPTSQVGGGICQVNTTLFNAALLSGVQITERVNHSLYIASYPLGRDATVSWPGPDFKFVNSLGHALLIATSSTSNSVTVSFYGVDPGYTVTIGTASWLSHTTAPEQRVDDPTLPVGTETVKQPGKGGGKVSFTQTVTRTSDGSLVFKKTFVSNYKTEPKITQVGTKPATATPAPATPADRTATTP